MIVAGGVQPRWSIAEPGLFWLANRRTAGWGAVTPVRGRRNGVPREANGGRSAAARMIAKRRNV
jgi:hypothetical protein